MQDANELPEDLSTAKEVILVQSNVLVKQKTEIDALKKEREELLAEIRFLRSGKKREKFTNADQMLLEFGEDKELQEALEAAKKEAEAEIERITYTRKKPSGEKKPASDKFPPHLPREVVEVAIPEAFQKLVDSGELIIKRYETTEALKQIPASLVVIQYKKPVLAYANNPEKELKVEEEANLGEKGRYHPSVAAQVVHGKFGLHLPYYRLQDMFASSGWTPSRSTLDYLVELASEVTEALVKTMQSRLMTANCLGLDDTHVKLIMPKDTPDIPEADQDAITQRLIAKMKEAKKEGKDSLDAKMWGYSSFDPSAPYDLFDFRVSRHRDGPDEFLSEYSGHVMADCYSGNMSVILAPGSKMTRMACWSHARRHVYEHQDHDKNVSALPLALMNQLYDIERRALQWSDEARGELRAKESRMILDRLKGWLDGPVAGSVLPASKLGGAFNYIRNHWDALCVYVTDGRLPIDNNQVERLMKRIAIGRKNWLFIGSVRAGIRNAGLMSLVASAQRQEIDLGMYLESAITHLLRGTARPEELLPDRWKANHPEAVRTYREQERRDKADTATLSAAKRRARQQLKKLT
ncbi:MAG: IS66 family transposase [bacterium]